MQMCICFTKFKDALKLLFKVGSSTKGYTMAVFWRMTKAAPVKEFSTS